MNYRRKFTIGKQEQQDYYGTLVAQNWWRSVVWAAALGAVVSWLFIYWTARDIAVGETLAVMLLTALLTAAITSLVRVVSTRRQVRDQIRRNGKEPYTQLVDISGFGVRVEADGREAKMGFEKLFKVMETKKAFYIFISRTHAWILPKDQMEDVKAESEQLRELFRTVIESRRLKFMEN